MAAAGHNVSKFGCLGFELMDFGGKNIIYCAYIHIFIGAICI